MRTASAGHGACIPTWRLGGAVRGFRRVRCVRAVSAGGRWVDSRKRGGCVHGRYWGEDVIIDSERLHLKFLALAMNFLEVPPDEDACARAAYTCTRPVPHAAATHEPLSLRGHACRASRTPSSLPYARAHAHAHARAQLFVVVKEDLVAVAELFPEVKKQIRHHAARLAARRAFVLYAFEYAKGQEEESRLFGSADESDVPPTEQDAAQPKVACSKGPAGRKVSSKTKRRASVAREDVDGAEFGAAAAVGAAVAGAASSAQKSCKALTHAHVHTRAAASPLDAFSDGDNGSFFGGLFSPGPGAGSLGMGGGSLEAEQLKVRLIVESVKVPPPNRTDH